ncbi:MAG: hypothetical protein HC806_10035 [Anaerolineae bacterium]|nr:hypothetical protein [Anaerolineae bacterium]
MNIKLLTTPNWHRLLSIGYIILTFFVTGCSTSSNQIEFPYDLMLSHQDLPHDWVRVGGSFPEVEGAITHLVAYSPEPEISWKAISHQIAIYPDERAAKEAFLDWEEWFTPAMSPVISEPYLPQNQGDSSRLEYLDVSFNGVPVRTYTYLQRHKNMIYQSYISRYLKCSAQNMNNT